MADYFTNLSKPERIEKAVCACAENNRLTVRKAVKIYNVTLFTITRRLKKNIKSTRVSY
jgi:hypothetical protein